MTQILTTPIESIERSEKRKPEAPVWCFCAAATVVVIIVAAIRWSLAHPHGLFWDEALYFNDLQIDAQRLRTGRLLKLGGRILIKNLGRPPAYRLFALPFAALFGFHATAARLTTMACYAASAFFAYKAARRIASPIAGAFAVFVFALSPEVVSASIFFSTDAPLYLATAAMLYYVFASWNDEPELTSNWIGLGVAVGLGFLAKTSFIAIGIPVLAFWYAANRWGKLGVPSLLSQRKAGYLALAIAGPWWALSLKGAVVYGEFARNFVRDSLGLPSVATWLRWLNTVVQCLLGHGISILIALVLVTCLVTVVVKRRSIVDRPQSTALLACASAGLPIVIAQLSGTNHLLRHISPAVVPLSIVVGVLADTSGWAHSRICLGISALLFCAQLGMLMVPVVHPNTEPVDTGFVNGTLPWRTMSLVDQWDWEPVRNLGDRCGVETPAISFLGGGRALDPPQIQAPWIAHVTSTRAAKLDIPDVQWLWRYEDGTFNLQSVIDKADQSDMVITAPYYVGEIEDKDDLDNQYNAEFEQRLLHDPQFQGPFHFAMGRFQPVDVEVFVKRNLVCRPGGLQ